ncbi:unnamed protein product [Peronospora belbahrii]|uniref:Chromo domain-containing protein n=1 Tax=Peronospora belbahrii TaxID=622444 RepID=A0AAU9LDF9_9STRA|nr:unnamed protein product [Peronospora belbahrii]
MFQTLARSIKMYVSDVGQQYWDEYAERLTFAMNTAQDRVRKETPFYLVHDWDDRTTLEATLHVINTRRREFGPRRWRYHIQQHYQRVIAQVNENLRAASQARILAHNEGVVDHKIQPGAQVRLYLDRVKEGLFPVVHLSKLKRIREFFDRPSTALETDEIGRVDFDEYLLPEDTWARELEEGEYEVEEILEACTGKRTLYERQQRKLLVRWKGYADPY